MPNKRKNKLLFILIILLTISITSSAIYAQDDDDDGDTPATPKSKRNRGDSTHVNLNFHGNGVISGIVVDRESKLPIDGAVITLRNVKDSTVKSGAITDNSGKFSVEAAYGIYKMNIDFIGYNGAINNRVLLRKAALLLDTIRLSAGTNVTEEIKVEDQRSNIEFQPGKKVFNVGNSDLYQNGSAVDVLKDVPSVTVDIDNNISLRGSTGVKILIDGRPSGLNTDARTSILEQIPADQIQSIELVTNPDAKYDAEGTSGIINIVLKKSNSFGINGVLNLGTGTQDKYNGSFSLNAKNSKMNIFGNYNYRLFNSPGSNSLNRFSLLDNTTLDQNSSNLGRMKNHSVKSGIDYYPDEASTLGFSIGYNDRGRKRGSTELTTQKDFSGNSIYSTTNKAEEDETGTSWNLDMSYVKKYKNPKQQLNIAFGYSRNIEDDNQTSILYDNLFPVSNVPKQNDMNDAVNNNGELSIDYVLPLDDKRSGSRFDIGYKGTIRNNDITSAYQNFDYNTNSFVTNELSSNRFNYKEIINAAYGIYSGGLKDFTYSFGLRAEQSNTTGDLITNNTHFRQDYLSIFPSVSLSQKFSLGQEVQATYSRRIRRPESENLNPFLERSDPLNLRQGNPELRPMFIDAYELSLINYLGQTVLTPSIYFRQTHDEITRFRTILDSNVTLTTFANNSSSKTYGAELIFNSKLFDLISLNGNVNYFRSEVDATNIQAGLVNSTNSWSGRLQAGAKLGELMSVQLSYNYSGKRVTGQGIIDPVQSMDIALRKDLFKKQASISFRISDVLDQQRFVVNLTNPNYVESVTRIRSSRSAFLTLSYNFGKQERTMNRKRRKDGEPDDITPSNDSGY